MVLVPLASACANQLAQKREQIDGLAVVFEGKLPKARFVVANALDPDVVQLAAIDSYEIRGARELAAFLSGEAFTSVVRNELLLGIRKTTAPVFKVDQGSNNQLRARVELYGWVQAEASNMGRFFVIVVGRIVLPSGTIWTNRTLGYSKEAPIETFSSLPLEIMLSQMKDATHMGAELLTKAMHEDAQAK